MFLISSNRCVLTELPFYVAQLAPVLLCVLYNCIVFVLVMINLGRGSVATPGQRTTTYQRLRIAATLMVLLGLTWIFGALSVEGSQRVFEYLFCVFTTLQGFFIFYFHCLRQPEVRQHWKWFFQGRGMKGWREKSIRSKTSNIQSLVRKAEKSQSATTSAETENRGCEGPETGSNFEMDEKALPSRDGPVQLTKFTTIAQWQNLWTRYPVCASFTACVNTTSVHSTGKIEPLP